MDLFRSSLRLRAAWIAAGLLLALPLSAASWEPLFNGRDLTGWKVINGAAPYVVSGGTIVGTTVMGSPNSFLATEKLYGDFIFECEVRQEVGPTNSGIQIRSESRPDYRDGRVHGYQFEIDPSDRAWTGGIYDESRRGWLYPLELNPRARSAYRYGEWNRVRIEAIGSSLRTWVNGVPVAHVVDNMTPRGFIALQVHSINKSEDVGRRILWRNLRIQTKDLRPSPADDLFIRNMIPNQVSAAEQKQGWRLLWDGRTTQGWRSVRGSTFPESGWKIADGELSVLGTKGGDIVTTAEFSTFEFAWEFKLSKGANSGVKYFVSTLPGAKGPSTVGLEYQLLDDDNHADAKRGNGTRVLASLYDVIGRGGTLRGAGIVPKVDEWQHGRIVVHADQRVEHWLNGIKVLEYVRGSPEFQQRIAASKFAAMSGFGLAEKGPILLQDHGDLVSFRSLKIRTP